MIRPSFKVLSSIYLQKLKKYLLTLHFFIPFEEARKLIEKAHYIALTNCACRISVHKCDKPLDVCIIFDGAAEFLVDRGYAWKASVDETINTLIKSEEAGLVHTSNNSKDRATVICNCCPCCCTVLRGRNKYRIVLLKL